MHMGMNLEDPHQIGKKHNLINTDKFTKDPYFCVFADIGKNCLYNWLMYTLCSVLILIKYNWDTRNILD